MTATPAAAQAERETPLLARARAAAGERHLQALAALTLLGGALRLATLGRQSFWFDETTTGRLIRMPLGSMLRAIPHIEATAPLYYVFAWLWARVFGFDEAGIRSLSALAGTVTVPVVYLAAREVATRRIGLVAAALTATSPLLVWYSQEVRAYAFLALFSALSFVIAPEAALLLRRGSQRVAVAALAGVVVVVVAVPLLVLAIRQRSLGYARWIGAEPFSHRAKQVLQTFAVGDVQAPPARHLLHVSAAAIVVLAAVLATQMQGRERLGARRAGRRGLAVAGAACALSLAVYGLVQSDRRLQRTDWRAMRDLPALRPEKLGLLRIAIERRDGFLIASYIGDRPRRFTTAEFEKVVYGREAAPWVTLLRPSGG